MTWLALPARMGWSLLLALTAAAADGRVVVRPADCRAPTGRELAVSGTDGWTGWQGFIVACPVLDPSGHPAMTLIAPDIKRHDAARHRVWNPTRNRYEALRR